LRKHLLIVDDNQDILDVLNEFFTEEGYRTTAITATENIIATVEEAQPDLFITDYILNGINGGEYCHQIKTNPTTAHIPVIILSAYPMVLNSLGDYGADAVVPKPFDIMQLSGTIKELLASN